MHNHAPVNYSCPFCLLAQGQETEYNFREDIVYEDESTLGFISPKWWVNNAGHVIVIPKKHSENIYDIDDDELTYVYKAAKKIAIAIKGSYQCDGISMRQHNEPEGGQDVWHFHVHVFPRYKDDNLYQNHDNKRFVSKEERVEFVEKLKNFFQDNRS